MNPLSNSFFTFLNASLFSLIPVISVVYIPNTWWGMLIKGIAIIFGLSAIINFMRPGYAQQHIYGGAAPGFVLIMPLLFFSLFLEPGFLKALCTFLFLFFWFGCFLLIYQGAKAKNI